MELTSKQRKHLEALAHELEPVVRIGKNGLIPTLIKTINESLEAQELIKVKILENCEIEKDAAALEIVEKTSCLLVRTIGRVLVLYRRGKKERKNRVELSPSQEPEPDPSKKARAISRSNTARPKRPSSKHSAGRS